MLKRVWSHFLALRPAGVKPTVACPLVNIAASFPFLLLTLGLSHLVILFLLLLFFTISVTFLSVLSHSEQLTSIYWGPTLYKTYVKVLGQKYFILTLEGYRKLHAGCIWTWPGKVQSISKVQRWVWGKVSVMRSEPREKKEPRSQAWPWRSRNCKYSVVCCPCDEEEAVWYEGYYLLYKELRLPSTGRRYRKQVYLGCYNRIT